MMVNPPIPPKRGRKPKAALEKCDVQICFFMQPAEYEAFKVTALPASIASFLREAVRELQASRINLVKPEPIPRSQGNEFTMLITKAEKLLLKEGAAVRRMPMGGFIRAAGMWKVSNLQEGRDD